MQRRTRSLIAIFVAVLVGGGLVACGSGGTGGTGGTGSGAGKTLHVFVNVNTSLASQQRAWFDRIKQKFKAQTGADIVFETFASANEEQTKIQTSAVSGSGPDVYALGTTFTPVAYATGGFHVFTDADWNKIGGRNRFFQPQLVMSGPDAQHDIGIPIDLEPFGLVYNTELFKAAGISQPPATWDEFIADAQKLTNPATGIYGAANGYADNFNPWKFIWMLTEQGGGRLVSDDLKKAQLDSDQVATATDQFFDQLTKDRMMDPKAAGWTSSQALAAFATGKAAMVPMVTRGVVPTLESSAVKGKYAFAPNPLVPPGHATLPTGGVSAGTIVSGYNLAIASYTKNLDLALAYINLVTSTEEQINYAQTFGFVPSNVEAATELTKTDPQVGAFVQAEKAAVATSFTGAWSDVQLGLTNVVTQSLPALAAGKYDPAKVRQLLADENRKVQASLDRQKH